MRPRWTPFVEAELPAGGMSDLIKREPGYVGTFRNSRYQVQVSEYQSPLGPMTWLCIVNVDRSAEHDWRDFQRIKNELMGPEREAFELYPAESRLVDTNNQWHLFVLPEGSGLPVGYADRDVSTDVSGTAHKQRPFEEPPPDLRRERVPGNRIRIFAGPPNNGNGGES